MRISDWSSDVCSSDLRHLQLGWNFFRTERNEMLDILPASQRVDERQWYLGTADAVTQNIDIIEGYKAKYIVILAGVHVYKMDYGFMLEQHGGSGAAVTVRCVAGTRKKASAFGLLPVGNRTRQQTEKREEV